jgi:hypothetical protein
MPELDPPSPLVLPLPEPEPPGGELEPVPEPGGGLLEPVPDPPPGGGEVLPGALDELQPAKARASEDPRRR